MVSKEATEISKEFLKLKKFDCIVVNFNTNRPVKHRSIQKLTDHIIIGKEAIYFIEVKLKSTKDQYKEHQRAVKTKLDNLAKKCSCIYSFECISLVDAKYITNIIAEFEKEKICYGV